ncbi:39S ribosomal protein L32, mitochondrial [Daphnia magna]|uniref:Large ribosomal subunit protein bL32m n=1 Tax=Daphnia magna TaxID=35525 RepID=A0A0P5YTD8_9CRUS|nr:39S ribosomal protein L32, mitochondrial [Daphnia magna]CAG4639669.1 EOG090X0IGM [Daphnia magna]SVE82834.1 EOG090X0IGM [Daphnia magna]SVE83420.1 EOG090X0IGM [Daphnia magna]
MAGHLLKCLTDALGKFEYVYLTPLLRRPPTPQWIPLVVQAPEQLLEKDASFDIKSIFDGFLWGVPTCRRSAEKRMMRKYGAPNWHNKLILPRKDIKTCGTCGHNHEAGRLCPNCYSKVKAETSVLQEKMVQELGLDPIDKEIAIVYQGEKTQFDDEFFKGKRVVQMEKPRPKWFSKNLLQRCGPNSDVNSSEHTIIKPHDLG